MALHKLVTKNYGGKLLVSIKYQNLHSFKEGKILLYQSTLETRRISHLHGTALFTIPLSIPMWIYTLIIVNCFPKNSMSVFKLKFKYSIYCSAVIFVVWNVNILMTLRLYFSCPWWGF